MTDLPPARPAGPEEPAAPGGLTRQRRWSARAATAVVAAVVVAVGGCTPDSSTPAPSTSTEAPLRDVLDVEAGRSDPVRDPVYPDYGNPSLDVLAYRLLLSWDPHEEELTGTATITIRAAAAVSALTLDFSKAYTVDGVTIDGATATASWKGSDISVPATVAKDARVTMVVRYHGSPKPVHMPSSRGDFDEGLGLRLADDGEAWTMQEPYGASTWYPVNDTPSDEAVYDLVVSVPAGWSAVAHGKLVGVRHDLAVDTFHWLSTDPVASYLTTLALGRYTMIIDSGEGGLPLTYWLRTGRDEDYEPAVKRTPELLAWLAERFGPYPFPSAGVVLVDSESAMETQQMVTFGASLGYGSPDLDGATETLLHEYAHQWFGDAVTPTDWNGVWLNEGWAMYCEILWSIDEGLVSEASWVAWARAADASSRPVAGPPGHPSPDHFAEINVYAGPAMMLRAIHKAIGDDAFFALGRNWVQRNKNTQVDRGEFTAFVNQHTGRDFTAVINAWLDSPTTPPA